MSSTEIDLLPAGMLSAEEAAEILQTTKEYVWRMGYRGQLRKFKIGWRVLYSRAEVEAYRKTHKFNPRRRSA